MNIEQGAGAEQRRKVSLRILLLVPIMAVLLVVAVTVYWALQNEIKKGVLELSKDELTLFSDSMRLSMVNLMRQGIDDPGLHSAMEQMRENNPTILHLRVVHGPSVTRQFGVHSDEMAETSLEEKVLTSGKATVEMCTDCEISQLSFVYPIRAEQSCLDCHQAETGEMLGLLSGTLDMSHIMIHVRNSERVLLYVVVVAALTVFVGLLYLLHLLLFRRIDRLKGATEQIAAGNFHVRLDSRLNDELGALLYAFNQMAVRLQQAMEILDQDLRNQTEQLGHMMEANRLLASSKTTEKALDEFVRTITRSVKVTCGQVLLLQDEERYLQVAASYPIRELSAAPTIAGCNHEECPRLFALLDKGESELLRYNDVGTEMERGLLFFNGIQRVLCLPVIHQEQALGIVLLGEERTEEREPFTDEKTGYALAMTNELAAMLANVRLSQHLMQQMEDAVFAMAEAVDKKSPWTAGHSQRVAEYARAIGVVLGWGSEGLEDLYRAGLLHDIGKIGTPGTILNKEGRLTPEEYLQLQRHPIDGADILMRMRSFAPLIPAVKYHHEHFDGSGYPQGLKSEEIPPEARIMAVADAFDAMISDRPYRDGMTPEEAWGHLQSSAGHQFDPEVVAAFRQVLAQLMEGADSAKELFSQRN